MARLVHFTANIQCFLKFVNITALWLHVMGALKGGLDNRRAPSLFDESCRLKAKFNYNELKHRFKSQTGQSEEELRGTPH